ncbi:hypothetical protein LTR28_010919 [Elasticomyces elasticus]|nr:hypothetical protein LTR28_010919 [Elasticomyces elasticus]
MYTCVMILHQRSVVTTPSSEFSQQPVPPISPYALHRRRRGALTAWISWDIAVRQDPKDNEIAA